MNEVQEAFLMNGRTHKAIWNLLSMYDQANREGRKVYTIFYDWSKAYDALPWYAMDIAMRRL